MARRSPPPSDAGTSLRRRVGARSGSLRRSLERDHRGRRRPLVRGHVRDGPRGRARRPGDAVERCLASARACASPTTSAANGRMAVIVQRMVAPVAAGVALTADPVTGDRDTMRRDRGARPRRSAGLGRGRGRRVGRRRGGEARRDGSPSLPSTDAGRRDRARGAADRRSRAGCRRTSSGRSTATGPLDPPGQTDDGAAAEVSWASPAPGAYTRQLRLGEWIGEPVTPLFESWLLTAMEERMHAWFF